MSVSQFPVAIPRFNFAGGFNTRFSKLALGENEVVDALNCHINPRGSLVKRKGIVKVVPSDTVDNVRINGLYQFVKDGENLLIRTKSGFIHYAQTNSWVDVTNGHFINGDGTIQWATFKDYVLLTDGHNNVLKWDGDTTGSGFEEIDDQIDSGNDTVDSAVVAVVHRRRLILGDVRLTESGVQTRYESRIIGSKAGTLDTWDTTLTGWNVDIDEGDGDSVTGLIDVNGVLVVFKQNSVYKVTNYGLSGAQQVHKFGPVGCPGPHAYTVVGNIVFWIDRQGHVWALNVFGQGEDAMNNLTLQVLGDRFLELINVNRLEQAQLVYDPYWAEIRAFLPFNGSNYNNLVIVFNTLSGGFTRFEYSSDMGIAARVFDNNNVSRILTGSINGVVYQSDTNLSDDGTDIEFMMITKADAFENLSIIKRLAKMRIYVKADDASQPFTFETRRDFFKDGTQYTATADPPVVDPSPPGSGAGGTNPGDTSSSTALDPTEEVADVGTSEGPVSLVAEVTDASFLLGAVSENPVKGRAVALDLQSPIDLVEIDPITESETRRVSLSGAGSAEVIVYTSGGWWIFDTDKFEFVDESTFTVTAEVLMSALSPNFSSTFLDSIDARGAFYADSRLFVNLVLSGGTTIIEINPTTGAFVAEHSIAASDYSPKLNALIGMDSTSSPSKLLLDSDTVVTEDVFHGNLNNAGFTSGLGSTTGGDIHTWSEDLGLGIVNLGGDNSYNLIDFVERDHAAGTPHATVHTYFPTSDASSAPTISGYSGLEIPIWRAGRGVLWAAGIKSSPTSDLTIKKIKLKGTSGGSLDEYTSVDVTMDEPFTMEGGKWLGRIGYFVLSEDTKIKFFS